MRILSSLKGLLLRRSVVAATVVGATAAAANADLSPIIFSVSASNANGSGTYQVAYDPGLNTPDGYFWQQVGAYEIYADNDGPLLAIVEAASFSAIDDPQVGMVFTVQAIGVNTNFSIGSGTLSFGPFANPNGIASAGLTTTDSDSNSFAQSNPLGGSAGASSFAAVTNLGIFGEDIGQLTVNNPSGSASGPYNTGVQGIPGSVSSMSVNFNFSLTGNDSASGTSVFFITPEPASLALLALGAAALRRRG